MHLISSYGKGLVLASLHHHDTAEVLTVVGIAIVIGCLIAAGVAAFRSLWLPVLLLVGVAFVTAWLLL